MSKRAHGGSDQQTGERGEGSRDKTNINREKEEVGEGWGERR